MIITAKEYIKLFSALNSDKKTQVFHFAGIFLLCLASLMLLSFVKISIPDLFVINLADLVVLGLLFLYFKLHTKLALVCIPVLLITLMIADLLTNQGLQLWSLTLMIIFFIIGAGLHYYAFMQTKQYPKLDSSYVCFIPFWLVSEVLFTIGYMKDAQKTLSSNKASIDS